MKKKHCANCYRKLKLKKFGESKFGIDITCKRCNIEYENMQKKEKEREKKLFKHKRTPMNCYKLGRLIYQNKSTHVRGLIKKHNIDDKTVTLLRTYGQNVEVDNVKAGLTFEMWVYIRKIFPYREYLAGVVSREEIIKLAIAGKPKESDFEKFFSEMKTTLDTKEEEERVKSEKERAALLDGGKTEAINLLYKYASKSAHPDVGGSDEAMKAVNDAKNLLIEKL